VIRGSTILFPMFGSPLARVRAPTLFTAHFEQTGVDAAMVPMEVLSDYEEIFRNVFKSPSIAGAMVTFPYKRCLDVIDEISPRSVVAQACNVVVKRANGTLYGDIFDGEGFARGLKRAGFQFADARCLVIGSGGAGAAIAAALADFGAACVDVCDCNESAAIALAERLNKYTSGRCRTKKVASDPTGYDLVVNATPMGMKEGEPFSFDVERLDPKTMVADLVMAQETALLRAAAARGCRTQPGTKMLFEQLSPVSEFWGYAGVGFDDVTALIKALGWQV